MHGHVNVKFSLLFLTTALDGAYWSLSRSGCLYPEEKSLGTNSVWGQVSPRPYIDAVKNENNLLTMPGIEQRLEECEVHSAVTTLIGLFWPSSKTFLLPFIGPCLVIYSYSTTNKMHLFLKLFILVKRSTCFGRSFRPSSGVQDCTYSIRYMS